LAFANFLVWRLRTGACGVGACGFWRYRMPPKSNDVMYGTAKKEWINPLPPSDAVRQQKKNILEDLLSSVLSQFKKYHPSGNLKFNYLDIFRSLKLHSLMEKNPFNFS